MQSEITPKTSPTHGRLWGARAQDWADIQEGMVRPVYTAVFERTDVKPGTRYLDVGCGAGMAAQMAASRGARVSGIDASEALLAIARKRVPEPKPQRRAVTALTFPLLAGYGYLGAKR